jgi:hypothetical protein
MSRDEGVLVAILPNRSRQDGVDGLEQQRLLRRTGCVGQLHGVRVPLSPVNTITFPVPREE